MARRPASLAVLIPLGLAACNSGPLSGLDIGAGADGKMESAGIFSDVGGATVGVTGSGLGVEVPF